MTDQVSPMPIRKTAFAFSGIGAQWKTMGVELFKNEAVFRQTIEECDRILGQYADWSLIEELSKDASQSRVEESLIAHPCNFSIQAALVALLRSWGVEPEAVVGHSAGEVAAAYTAGVLDLNDAINIVWHHCMLMRQVIGKGRMAHISLPWNELRDLVEDRLDQVIVAAVNSPKATVLSGDVDVLEKLVAEFESKDIFCRMLRIDIPFHSSEVEPYREEFQRAIDGINLHPAQIPIYSSFRGAISAAGDYTASYWSEHIRQQVSFGPAIGAMIRDGYNALVEIGAHPVLSTSLHECFEDAGQEHFLIAHTLKRHEPEKRELLASLATLHVGGRSVQWERLSPEDRETGRQLIEAAKQELEKSATDLSETLQQASPAERHQMLVELIREAVAVVSDQAIIPQNSHTGFQDMGLTSLTAIHLTQQLSTSLGLPLSSTLMFDHPNMESLAGYLESRVAGEEGPTSSGAPHIGQRARETEHEPLAVVGMSCRFPGGANSPEQFWELLQRGGDAVCEVPRERFDIDEFYAPDRDIPGKIITRQGGFLQDVDLDAFDAHFFQISPTEARNLDPQQRLLLEVTYEAFEYAGIPVDSLKESLVGVYVGICCNDFTGNTLWDDIHQIDVYSATGSLFSCAAGRLSYAFKLQGPNFPIDTACSSSLVALDSACKSLRARTSNIAVVAGVNLLLNPHLFIYFSKLGAISPDGRCKTFDSSADGYGRGEGCGAVVLKRLSDAEADGDRILAVVRGTAINHDGPSSSFTAPNGTAQQNVIRQALEDARLTPEQVDCIEAHGTGTMLGDPIEVNALGAMYGQHHTQQHPLMLSSVKANIGHLEGAAGIAGIIKAILALTHETIPPQVHFQTPNPHIPWETLPIDIPTAPTPWKRNEKPRIVGINSFGFSGTNAHAILEEAPVKDRRQQGRGPGSRQNHPMHILNLSAKSQDALDESAIKYIEYLNTTDENLADICYTANVGRSHFDHRLSVFGRSQAELIEKLSRHVESEGSNRSPAISKTRSSKSQAAFLFTGQGSQYPGMGRELYETHSLFREALDRCDECFKPYLQTSIAELLYADPEQSQNGDPQSSILHQTLYTQPAIFSVEYALLELWRSWGVRSAALAGHSIGEYTAAYAAGVFSLEDAAKLVSARGRLMQSLPQGGLMAAVFADETTVSQAMEGHGEQVSIAAVNGPTSVVLSGAEDAVEVVLSRLKTDDIDSRRLRVSHAFHSPLMEPILDEFRATASEIDFSPPELPLISNVSGTWATATEVTNAEYWTRHIREAVRFYDGMQTLDQAGYTAFLELGADAVLTGLGKRCLPESQEDTLWLTSLHRKKKDWEQLAQSLGQLYMHAVEIDWSAVDAPYHRRKVTLPTYPFQRQHYEIPIFDVQQTAGGRRQHSSRDDHPFIGQRIESPLLAETVVFQSVFNAEHPDFLQEHVIYGEMISPAAAHISMVLSAVRALFNTCSCSIEEVDFLQPLIVGQEYERTVQIIIEQTTSERMPFRIVSRRDVSESWSTHCSGFIRLEGEVQQADQPQWQPDGILSRCQKSLSGTEFKQKFWDTGYHLGEHFQSVEQIRYEGREALTSLKVIPGLPMYEIHPGLIDSIWQTISVASMDILDNMISKNQMLIPLTLARFRCHSTNFTDIFQAHSHCRPQEGFVDGDTTIRSDNGELLVEVEHLVVRETNKEVLLREIQRNALMPSEYAVEWQHQDVQKAEVDENAEETYLIFSDRKGCGEALQTAYQNKHMACIRVTPGSGFEQIEADDFSLNPARLEDFDQLFETISQREFKQPFRVLFLWPLNTEFPADMTSLQLEQGLRDACEGLLNLIKSLANHQWETYPRLWLVTQHAHHISGEHSVNLPQSALIGLARTIALEHPEIWGSHIDLGNDLTGNSTEMLFDEIENSAVEETEDYQVSLRDDNRRYVARLKRTPAPRENQRTLVLQPNATYWITGGLGALGLLMADALIRKGARHLLLSGRSAPGPAAEKELKDFRAQGVQIRVEQVDVTDADTLAGVLSDISGDMPPVKGIIHAAGMLDVDLLTSQTWDRFRQVFSAKALGAWNLHRLTREMPLDFFLLFSSVASLLGDRGQGNYSSANAFLDELAHFRKARDLVATSVNWGPWAAGMAASEDSVEAEIRKRGFEMLQPDEGMAFLDHIIADHPVQLGIMKCDLERFVEFLRIQRTGFFADVLSADQRTHRREQAAPTAAVLPEIAGASPEERVPLVVEYLRQAVGHVIGSDPQEWDDNAPLNSLGLDSLMAVEMRNRVKQELSVDVPVVKLMEDTGLSDLACFIAEQLIQPAGDESAVATPDAMVEGEL